MEASGFGGKFMSNIARPALREVITM